MITPKNISMHELIGLRVEAEGKAFGYISGVVVDETKNTFVISSQKGEKRIPKRGATFTFIVGRRKMTLDGQKIAFRPHERPKKLYGKI
ncbi:MAG: ribonuclease P protein subunit [Candidatus Anstonellales archaeon]